jgi:L-lactate permease
LAATDLSSDGVESAHKLCVWLGEKFADLIRGLSLVRLLRALNQWQPPCISRAYGARAADVSVKSAAFELRAVETICSECQNSCA